MLWGQNLGAKETAVHLTSPCLTCSLKDEDKNNGACKECRKRILYLNNLSRDLEYSGSMPVELGYPLHLPR